jgi:hypothetical protein
MGYNSNKETSRTEKEKFVYLTNITGKLCATYYCLIILSRTVPGLA